MTYAKFLANAAWAGFYVTLLTAALLILMNGVPPGGSATADLARAAASLAPVYVPSTALLLSSLFVFLRFFAVRRLHARWQSFKAIVWFGTAALGGFTAVSYLNLRWISPLLSPPAREALRLSAAVMAASFLASCALASLAQFRLGAAARVLRVSAGVALIAPLVVLAAFSTTIPSAAGGPPSPGGQAPARDDPAAEPAEAGDGMVLLGLDAASMDQILPLVAAGELPAFDRLMRRGASSRLNTLRPCAPPVAWAALITGRPPWVSGLRGIERQTLPFGPDGVDLVPRALGLSWLRRGGYIRSVERERPWWGEGAMWDSARAAGLEVAVAGWDPAPETAGVDTRVSSRVERILGEAASAVPPDDRDLHPLRRAVAADLAARDAALSFMDRAPRLVAVRFVGLAEVVRRYLRHHAPGEFGDVPGSRKDPLAHVVTGYYEFLDEILADLTERSGEGRFLMVVSSHGVEPLPVWERLVRFSGMGGEREDVSGSWRRGPDGVLLLAGPGVQPGARPEEVDLLDVAPTAAYLLGLPIERGMRGNLLRRLLRPEYLEAHPVHFVPGHAAVR